jgi:capsular exopolysaccharide synthesis family protein
MNHTPFDKHLVSLTAPSSFAAEQYQALRLKIERIRQTRELRVIAITSPGAADGKTVTSINLAGALARGSHARVLLIDADLRRPAIAQQLHVDGVRAGVAELVANEDLRIGDAIHSVEPFNVDVIAAGEPTGPVHELFRSPQLARLLSESRERYDYVIIDTPPLVPVVDSALLARLVDGVLLVVAANRTPRKLLEEALNQLDASKVLGIVFNSDRRPLYGYYDSGYRRYFSRNRQSAASL